MIEENNINLQDKNYKTNFCKKLIYFIKKILNAYLKYVERNLFEDVFYEVFKHILLRGANYFRQDKLHILNKMVKSSDSYTNFNDIFLKFIKEFDEKF